MIEKTRREESRQRVDRALLEDKKRGERRVDRVLQVRREEDALVVVVLDTYRRELVLCMAWGEKKEKKVSK